jgi:hypothetical protein
MTSILAENDLNFGPVHNMSDGPERRSNAPQYLTTLIMLLCGRRLVPTGHPMEVCSLKFSWHEFNQVFNNGKTEQNPKNQVVWSCRKKLRRIFLLSVNLVLNSATYRSKKATSASTLDLE